MALSRVSARQEIDADAARGDVQESLHAPGLGDTHTSPSDSILLRGRADGDSIPLRWYADGDSTLLRGHADGDSILLRWYADGDSTLPRGHAGGDSILLRGHAGDDSILQCGYGDDNKTSSALIPCSLGFIGTCMPRCISL